MEMLDDKKINSLIGWQKSVSTDFASIIESIKQNYASDVIKDWETVPIIRLETLEEVGYCIKIYLNGKYNYGKAILNDWEKKLGADNYAVITERNKLVVRFEVHDKK